MFRVQTIFTALCNLYDYRKKAGYGSQCPYCSMYSNRAIDGYYTFNGVTKPIKRELTAEEWVQGAYRVINTVKDTLLFDMTGGEPTLYKDLPEVLKRLNYLCSWAVTSNSLLTRQIEKLFADDIPLPLTWTA